jgi:hypothetical protein
MTQSNHGVSFLPFMRVKRCQDAMQYVTVNSGSRPTISAAILQAPVSDVEFFEIRASEEAKRWLATAQSMVAEGKGQEYLPLAASLSFSFDEPNTPDLAIPYTAYRFASLYGRRCVLPRSGRFYEQFI